MHPKLLENSTFLQYYSMWQSNPSSIVFVPIAEFFILYGMYDEAVNICKTGLYYHPNSVSGRIAMAKAFLANNDLESAREHACHALLTKTDNVDAKNILDEIKKRHKDTSITAPREKVEETEAKNIPTVVLTQQKVAQETQKAIVKFQKSFNTITMAHIYLNQGHYDKAKRIFEDILNREPENEFARRGLAQIQTGAY